MGAKLTIKAILISSIGWIISLVGCSGHREPEIVSILVKVNSDAETKYDELNQIASDYMRRASTEASDEIGSFFAIHQPRSDTVLLVYLVEGECEFGLNKVQQSLETHLNEHDRVLMLASTFLECADSAAYFEQENGFSSFTLDYKPK